MLKLDENNEYGIKFNYNNLNLEELLEKGYKKVENDKIGEFEQLFKVAPNILLNECKTKNIENVIKNSYKCILDPNRHLATVKGTSNIFIGAALDNDTNQLKGQARWIKNDKQLEILKIQNIISNTYNVLSLITAQHFLSQINTNLVNIKNNINNLQKYMENREESEINTSFQEVCQILNHLKYIKEDDNRLKNTIINLDNIRKIAKNSINMQIIQLEYIKKSLDNKDKKELIKEKFENSMNCLNKYLLSIITYNTAHIIKIYLNNITDIEELKLYRNEIELIIEDYEKAFNESNIWLNEYVENVKSLNKFNIIEIGKCVGEALVDIYKMKNNLFLFTSNFLWLETYNNIEENKIKIKDEIIYNNEEYREKLKNNFINNNFIIAIDEYIDNINKQVSIVMINKDYYIKYLEKANR